MADDPRVFIYGQDVGAFGGAFKATKNLAKEFPGRVLDAPISEDAMVGLAVGAAIEGMRPIVEMQFADFSTGGFNQIVNQAATLFWRTEVPCPITVRLPSRRHSGQRTVSQPEHGGALRALSRSGRHDARRRSRTPISMLLEAVAIDDPVHLLRAQVSLLPPQGRTLAGPKPCHAARRASRGRDATLPSSPTARWSMRLLPRPRILLEDGYEIEVVDLRSVKPLDTDTVLASVARTGRCSALAKPGRGVE